jgi:hypothetical protein
MLNTGEKTIQRIKKTLQLFAQINNSHDNGNQNSWKKWGLIARKTPNPYKMN